MELNRPNHHTLYTHTASTRLPGDPRFLDPTPLKVSMPYKTGCLPGERPMYLASNSPFLDARYSKRENEQKNSLFSKYVTSRNNVIRVVSLVRAPRSKGFYDFNAQIAAERARKKENIVVLRGCNRYSIYK